MCSQYIIMRTGMLKILNSACPEENILIWMRRSRNYNAIDRISGRLWRYGDCEYFLIHESDCKIQVDRVDSGSLVLTS